MKKSFYRLSWYILILLVLTISIGFWQATGQAEEQPVGETSENNQTPSIKPEGMSGMFKGTVVEVLDAGRHIYVYIDIGEQRVWVAVPAFDGKPGDKVVVPPGVPVADFQSKKLNRMFKMIYFVGGIRRVNESSSDYPTPTLLKAHSQVGVPAKNRMTHTSMDEIGEDDPFKNL